MKDSTLSRRLRSNTRTLESLELKNKRLEEQVTQKQRLLDLAEDRITNAMREATEAGNEVVRGENQRLSKMVNELNEALASKTKEIETMENDITQFEETIEAQNDSSTINYEQEKKITRLEIDLEGQQRLCGIQEARCKQLQTLLAIIPIIQHLN